MEKITLGIIREGKEPPDRRVPLTPQHCKQLKEAYPNLEVLVQTSPIRGYSDDEYRAEGITVQEDMSSCDILMGVKEVPIDQLVPGKKYFFFSHTIKEQPYNKKLLQAVLQKNIQLIDYECLTYPNGFRIIGFGRYAGIVGAYNALIGYGKRTGQFDLKPAHQCLDKEEMDGQLKGLALGSIKIAITGMGRVAGGAMETLDAMGVKKVEPNAYVNDTFDHPVYCQLGVVDYNAHKEGLQLPREHFFENPEEYNTAFHPYLMASDVFVSCHFWDPRAPRLFSKEEVREEGCKLQVIADISCDIGGSVPTTLQASTIENPFYGYNRGSGELGGAFEEGNITIMAVDNLPCELPRDSSRGFGNDLIKDVLPHLLGEDAEGIIANSSITRDGVLTEKFKYLSDYARD